MTTAERLINRISEIINGPQRESTPEIHELASQLQETCHSLNERLFNIRNFLRKGMRSEAVREAQAPPSVFELAETLNFKDWKKWQEFCLEKELPSPSELDLDTVKSLKTECDKEQLLEPLLQEFRRLVHTGNRDQKINILRQLRKQDTENPIWEENLIPLEEDQIEDLQEQAQAAIGEDDETTVKYLLQELTHPDRIAKPSSETISQCENFLQKKREKRIAEEGEKTSRKLQEKLTAGDYSGLTQALKSWQQLENTPGFKASPEQLEIANRVRKEITAENERNHQAEEVEKYRSQLQAQLESSEPDPDVIEEAWQRLESLDEKSAADLKRPVQEQLQQIREKAASQRRRQSFKKQAIAAVIIIFILAAGWFGYRFLSIQHAERKMSNLWQEEKYGELSDYLNKLEKKPAVFNKANAKNYQDKLREYFQNEEERKSNLEKLLEELQKIQQAGYPIEERGRIKSLLSEANELAVTDKEQEKVENHESDWEEHRSRRRAQLDRQLTRQEIVPIRERLEEIQETNVLSTAGKVEGTGNLLEQVRQTIETTEGASDEKLQELFNLRQEIEEAKTEYENLLRKKQAMVEVLRKSDGQIDQWKNALADYLNEFPDTALRSQIEQASTQAEWARDGKALANFRLPETPLTENEVSRIQEQIFPLPAGEESVWHESLVKITARPESLELARNRVEELHRLDFYNFKKIRIRKHGEEAWKTYYTPGTIHKRTERTEEESVTHYWGKVYGMHPESGQRKTEHFNVTDKTHEIEYSERSEENRMALAKHIDLLLLQVPEDEALIEYLLNTFEKLLEEDDFPLIPKAKAMEIIGQALAEGALISSPGIETYQEAFRGINLDLPWYNHKNPAVLATEERIRNRLKETAPPSRTIEEFHFHRKLWQRSLNRGLKPVGILWPENRLKNENIRDKLRPMFFNSRYSTLWAIQENYEGSAYLFYELEIGSEGYIEKSGNPDLAAGQLIFAPADNLSSKKTLQMIEPPAELKTINWPTCWPLNKRELP